MWAKPLILDRIAATGLRRSTCAIVACCLAAALCCGCGGCRTTRPQLKVTPPVPAWREAYAVKPVPVDLGPLVPGPGAGQTFALAVQEMRLWDLLTFLARESGRPIVCDQALLEKRVTLDLKGQNLGEALSIIARLVRAECVEIDGLWFVGQLRASDKALLVRRVRGMTQGEVEQAVRTLVTEGGSLTTYKDGLLILAESAEVVRRVNELLNQIESNPRPQWAVQLYLVTLSQRDVLDLGLDTVPALDLAVSQAVGSVQQIEPVKLNASLRTVLQAANERSSVAITAQPLFLLLDGERAEFQRGTRIPIPQRTVSDQGTVTTTGFTFVESGTSVKVEIRELSARSVRLDCNLELSDLVEVTADGAPRSDVRSYHAAAAVESGGTYLLASIEIGRRRSGRGTWLHMGLVDDQSQEVLQVWARCQSVTGEALR